MGVVAGWLVWNGLRPRRSVINSTHPPTPGYALQWFTGEAGIERRDGIPYEFRFRMPGLLSSLT